MVTLVGLVVESRSQIRSFLTKEFINIKLEELIMGYQESFIKFKDQKTLIEQLKRYEKREKSDLIEIICVDRVKKEIFPFKQGELVAVVGGERSEQRDLSRLRKELGISKIQDIVFIDNPIYWEMAMDRDVGLGDILGEHFKRLSDEEYAELKKQIN